MPARIVTLTVNPAIDLSAQAASVQPGHKIRTFDERYDPGGGGINVARVIRELGGETLAVFASGGVTGMRTRPPASPAIRSAKLP